ncbi:MAG TPA: T9SS type A sorting domain-containing protein [Bacteroidia bacterium]|nr:T9SS type A sorting domain-containing protein [Bacteroidia bacterium]
MKTSLSLLFFSVMCFNLNAQQFRWAKSFDHQGFGVSPSRTQADYDNSLLTFGSFAVLGARIDLDPDPVDSFVVSSFQYDGYISKYSETDGSLLWSSGLGNDFNGDFGLGEVLVDHSGNHLISGYLSGNVDIDLTSLVLNVSNTFNSSAGILVKYDSAFNYIQHILLSGLNNEAYVQIRKMDCDDSNNYFLFGSYYDSVDIDPGPGQQILFGDSGKVNLFLAKFDQSLNLLWVDTFITQAHMGPGFDFEFMHYDSWSGNLLMMGNFQTNDTIDLDPGTGQALLYNPFDESSFIAIYNSSGQFLRMWQSTGHYSNDVDGIATDDNGYIYQLVDFEDTLFLQHPSSPPYLVSAFPNSGYGVVKYDMNGNYIASSIVYSADEPEFNSIVERNGKLYIAGSMDAGTMDVDPSTAVYNLSAANGSMFLLCYASSLGINSFLWGFSDPDSDSENEQFNISENGTMYVSGAFQDSLECDPGPQDFYLYAPAYGYNFHIAYDSTSILALSEPFKSNSVSVYPNPVHDYLQLNASVSIEGTATVCNMLGEELLKNIDIGDQMKIDVSELSDGMYFLQLLSDKKRQVLKFMKVN